MSSRSCRRRSHDGACRVLRPRFVEAVFVVFVLAGRALRAPRGLRVFIRFLLWQCNGLRLLVADADRQTRARGSNRKVAVAEAANEIKRFSRRLLVRESHRVVGNTKLDRGAYLRRRAKESVCGHKPIQRLVRSLEVVAMDEERNPARAIGKVSEDRAREKLIPQRLPKPLNLPERLRVLRPTLYVSNAVPSQLLFEFGRASPRSVLASLVRQNFARLTEVGNSALQCLHDEHRPLVMRQRVRHEKTRMVVHETSQVEPLVLA